MTTGPVAYVRSLYHRCFPERQIYHRCNGQVQFTTVSGRAQIFAILLVSGTLGWLAYASVNVMFTEQINERINADLRDSTRRWEAKLAEMQSDYERLHTAVSVVEDELEGSLRGLEERQQRVDTVFEQKDAILKRQMRDQVSMAAALFTPPEANPNTSVSILNMEDLDPTPRRSRLMRPADEASVHGLSDILRNVPATRDHAKVLERHVTDFETLERRIILLETDQYRDLVALEESTDAGIAQREKALMHLEIDIDPMIEKQRVQIVQSQFGDVAAQGGPFISATAADLAGEDMDRYMFVRRTHRVQDKLQTLAALSDTLSLLPVTRPVDAYRITSGFGPRPDPFSGRLGMHFGLDIAGLKGTPVVATADGVITKSGFGSGYGNMVKIDHGNGFETIFGHLNSRKVKRGQKVERGDVIGTLGNTGRSTAPHLHYEIKHDGKAVSPMKFFEAGRYVFENEG